jgi:hypothetical protein
MTRTELHTTEWYLNDPAVRKWIRQCAGCGQYGRDPNSPPVPKARFERMFLPLELNEIGLCETCSRAQPC